MIPGDLASRLRNILEASIQPVSISREIDEQLPRLVQGERFSAKIQSALPDGSFRALVAGKTITLAMSESSASAGDVVELTVTGSRGNTLLARLTTPDEPQANAKTSDARSTLSQTGQLISQLLTGRHGEAKPLNLPAIEWPATQGSLDAGRLAPMLKEAISQSGMFYESHLRQWTEGSRPLASLLAEPQSAATTSELLPPRQEGQQAAAPSRAEPSARSGVEPDIRQRPVEGSAEYRSLSGEPLASAPQNSLRLPEHLTPLILQQLETLSSQQASWQGQLWPGARVQWSIVDPDSGSERQEGSADTEAPVWRSQLRLELPRLGALNASLTLGPQGVGIQISATDAASAARLREDQGSLQAAFAAAGLPLTRFQVREDVIA
ncbi:flagellar hook-length control protein FliK [Uliginosibacterium paludis]|uniref:Flagellar hook-length control protein FliK n=1 Tax=Uliginosibacterium paludis TaxID=1615952 RepID=A0ABV2CK28_9RHOO